jgi:hypothetical protein
MASNAYWISPSGEVIEIGSSHIDYIFRNPDTFGLTQDYIREVHTQYNEPLGQEGKARDVIMTDLVREGWIRVRQTRDEYHIQLNRLNNRNKDILFDFASNMRESPYTPIFVMPMVGTPVTTTFGDLRQGMLHAAKRKYSYIQRF